MPWTESDERGYVDRERVVDFVDQVVNGITADDGSTIRA
ncbi:MAG: hypothetical protein J07HR59_00728 [Halorubrum sp. J07HR59]|jgi:hypothetical protein|nr:MAG: hypothetical protein J07HR59_00728 [Halorubrum sp. J07HR59]